MDLTLHPANGADSTTVQMVSLVRAVALFIDTSKTTLLALCIAESELIPRAERWASKKLGDQKKAAQSLIVNHDREGLRALVRRLTADGGSDISFGLTQQTYRWSRFWTNWDDMDALLVCREYYFKPAHALTEAARRMKQYEKEGYSPQQCLEKWNKPNGTVAPGVGARYAAALVKAERMLRDMDLSDRGFDEKFLALANELANKGYDPGWPGNDATYMGSAAIQLTENGAFVWQEGREPVFFRTHRPQQAVAPAPDLWEPPQMQSSTPHYTHERTKKVGCILHGTHGRGATIRDEFYGTLSWFKNPAAEVSSHIVIAHDGMIANVVDPWHVAWHAAEHNRLWLGIEFVKRAPGRFSDVLSEAQYKAAAWWLIRMAKEFGFPLEHTTLPEHRETTQGRRVGKIDLGQGFDRLKLMHWIGALRWLG